MNKLLISFSAAALIGSLHAENFIRNGGFEYGQIYNGSVMRTGKFDTANTIYSKQKAKLWRSTPFEGWWLNLPQPEMKGEVTAAPNAHQGKRTLKMTGGGALESDHRPVPGTEKTVTLSFEIRTSGAAGTVFLNLTRETANMFQRPIVGSGKIRLPENTGGKFRRITLTAAIPENRKRPEKLLASMRIELKSGSFELDSVQLEPGGTATEFKPRPGEWLGLKMDDFGTEHLPRYYADGKDVKKAGLRTLFLTNTAGFPLSGTLNIYLDQWRTPGKTKIGTVTLNQLPPGKSIGTGIEPGKLAADAYIVLAELIQDGKVTVSVKEVFDPKQTGNGSIGNHMLAQYNAMRLAVFPGVSKEKTFGVGNSMVGTNQHWAGFQLDNYTLARETGVVGLLGSAAEEGQLYHCAIAGAQQFGGYWIDGASDNPACNNPAGRNLLDIFSDGGRAELKRRAENLGKKLALGPGVNGVKLRNESVYFNGGTLCPTPAADRDFREWCKQRHKTLADLNRNWGTEYKSWNEVTQVVSAKMAALAKTSEKKGAAAIDWFASMGKMGTDTVALMKQNPGQAMDWLRWRTDSSLRMYREFIETAKKYDGTTLYGTNLCWPNFWPQMAMRFYRFSDAPMLDLQYSAGHGKDLGNSDEMLDMLEMAESTVPGKPIWGIEVYVQPSFPDAFPALQNWAMVAHGMTNNLVFAWKPYSDHGPSAFRSGPRSWEAPKSWPMWMMIDVDGTKLPLWDSNLRSAKEIAAFHGKYDGLSLKRLKSRIGWYLSPDTAELSIFHTANKPYASRLTSSRITPAAMLRMNGVTLNYLDDETLSSIMERKYDTVLLPPSPVLSDRAAEQLAAYVKNGGTLVLLGPAGAYDPWLKLRPYFGGNAWKELNWSTPKHWKDIDNFIADFHAPAKDGLTVCTDQPPLPGGKSLTGADGREIARELQWGKGRIIAATVYPNRYSPLTHVAKPLGDYMKWLIKTAALTVNARWLPERENTEDDLKAKVGHGAPIVEIVIREKSPKEKFVFILNQGGAGNGTACIPVRGNKIQVENAITGEKIKGKIINGEWQYRMSAAPWQYLVLRISSK